MTLHSMHALSWVECGTTLTDSRFRDRNQRLQLSMCLQPELLGNTGLDIWGHISDVPKMSVELHITMFGSWRMNEI